ncbi:MAG: hypothetical protein SNH73_04680 [Rikenellaceae bacterium]
MRKVVKVLLASIACLAVSCDDATVYSESDILEGNKALSAISEAAFGEGDKSIIATDQDDIFYYEVDDQQEADEFIDAVTCGSYLSGALHFELSAGLGSVDVEPSDVEGCFYVVDFDVKTLPAVTYIVATDEYIDENN